MARRSLPSLRHMARPGSKDLGLLSEPPPRGQNAPVLSSGRVEVGAGLCRAVPCHGELQPRSREVWDSLRGPDAPRQQGMLRLSLATCIVSKFPG